MHTKVIFIANSSEPVRQIMPKLAQEAQKGIDLIMEHYNIGLLMVVDKWNHFAAYPEKAYKEHGNYPEIWAMPKISSYSGDGPAELKIVLDTNGRLKQSYLGPPESYRN